MAYKTGYWDYRNDQGKKYWNEWFTVPNNNSIHWLSMEIPIK